MYSYSLDKWGVLKCIFNELSPYLPSEEIMLNLRKWTIIFLKIHWKGFVTFLQNRFSYKCDVQGQTCEELCCRAPHGSWGSIHKKNPKSLMKTRPLYTRLQWQSSARSHASSWGNLCVTDVYVANKDAFRLKSDWACSYLCLLPPSFPRAFLIISHLRD